MHLLEERLEKFKSQGLERTLQLPTGIDFSSNDYLGFAENHTLRERFIARLKGAPCGASGARLLRGNLALYEETEEMLAQFVHREAALLFSSGYAANVGLLSAILNASDLVFSDAYNHASIIDGIRLSKAEKVIFPHRDYAVLEIELNKYRKYAGLKIIVTESVFGMEGTQADLYKLAELAQKYNALLIVDEAHSTGLWGASLVATCGLSNKVFATVHAAGKALGASGAWVAGNHLLKKYLVQFARSFLFSTAPIPALPILLQESIRFYAETGEERAMIVKQRAQMFRRSLSSFKEENIDVPIISILIGQNKDAIQASDRLQKNGFDVRAIRFPTVPENTARLRVTVKWKNTEEQLEKLTKILQ